MALRDQPYLPLYIQDIMTCEKLNECSAATHGIFIKGIMCLMHKSETYGKILLKQNYKQVPDLCLCFANQLVKHLPYTAKEIHNALLELITEKVCHIENDFLINNRMVKDNATSEKRATAGKTGGKKTQIKNKDFASIFAKAKKKATPENDIVIEFDNKDKNEKEVFTNPFSQNFLIDWQRWKDYKRTEFSFQYKSSISEQAAVNELVKVSGGNETTAKEIIMQSITNGWKGFFDIKKQQNGNKSKPNNLRAEVQEEFNKRYRDR